MRDFFVPLWGTLKDTIPSVFGALLILFGAWIFALIVAAAIRATFRRTKLDRKIVEWTGSKKPTEVEAGGWVARIAYYLILLLGIIGFFDALDLQAVSAPFNSLLGEVFEFAPRLLGAAMLLLVAFIAATFVRMLVTKVLETVDLDRRLGDSAETKTGISGSIANTLYWLIFLLFLPMVLDALALDGLLAPVQTMLDRFLGFLPNLFAAGVILGFGWLAAKIVRQVVTNLLAAAGVDRLMASSGVDSVLGRQRLSGLIGLVVYVLILLPVSISALDALRLGAISEPAGQMLSTILQAIPGVFTAALILFIAYTVGRFLSGLVGELLARTGFDNLPSRLGLGWRPTEGKRTPSQMVGYLVLVATLFFAAIEALRQLRFDAMAGLLVELVEFGGHVLLGLIIFGVGLFLANLAGNLIGSSQRQERGMLSMMARTAILVLAGAMALNEMGVSKRIIELAFGAGVFALALGGALAFGLGGREAASRALEGWSRRISGRE